MLKQIMKGEEGRKETVIDGDMVTVHHVTANQPGTDNAAHYQLAWTFDFSEVSREELEKMAAAHLVINIAPGRAAFKKLTNAELKEQGDSWAAREYIVRDYLDGKSVRVSKVEKAKGLASKMSEQEKKELLEQLQRELED